jgi:hypothetical protein
MKKVILALLVIGISLPSFAGLKEKHLIGSWTFKVETEYETMTGTLKFEKKEGKLTGTAHAETGESVPLNNIDIRDNDVLYFEVQPDYEVLQVVVTVKDKKYEGTVGNEQGGLPISGEKIE